MLMKRQLMQYETVKAAATRQAKLGASLRMGPISCRLLTHTRSDFGDKYHSLGNEVKSEL